MDLICTIVTLLKITGPPNKIYFHGISRNIAIITDSFVDLFSAKLISAMLIIQLEIVGEISFHGGIISQEVFNHGRRPIWITFRPYRANLFILVPSQHSL